jgi:hypothetical protein
MITWPDITFGPINLYTIGKNYMIRVTGRLEYWNVQSSPNEEEFILWGKVWDDAKHRFRNGSLIHTAGIAGDHTGLKEGDIVTTRNSVYLLGKKKGNDFYNEDTNNEES